MSLTNYAETQLLNAILRGQTVTFPTGTYIGLTSDSPSEANPSANEITGSGYARVFVGSGAWSSPATDGTGMLSDNSSSIEFPTALDNWGWVSGVIIADTESNIWFAGDLTTPRQITTGGIFRFSAGSLDVKFD